MTEIRYEFIEVDSTDKVEQARLARLGYTQYGMRRDTGDRTYAKLRRPVGKEKK
jgi:hypothetical protein